jgi:hypothetical protein
VQSEKNAPNSATKATIVAAMRNGEDRSVDRIEVTSSRMDVAIKIRSSNRATVLFIFSPVHFLLSGVKSVLVKVS